MLLKKSKTRKDWQKSAATPLAISAIFIVATLAFAPEKVENGINAVTDYIADLAQD